jgi:hypothetical protein
VGANDDATAEPIAQQARPGDVIGVDMRLDRGNQLETQLLDQLRIARNLLAHRVDQYRLAAAFIGEQVAVGRRLGVEELSEDHCPFPMFSLIEIVQLFRPAVNARPQTSFEPHRPPGHGREARNGEIQRFERQPLAYSPWLRRIATWIRINRSMSDRHGRFWSSPRSWLVS